MSLKEEKNVGTIYDLIAKNYLLYPFVWWTAPHKTILIVITCTIITLFFLFLFSLEKQWHPLNRRQDLTIEFVCNVYIVNGNRDVYTLAWAAGQ